MGFTTADAYGSRPDRLWWSVTMVSIPRAEARSTSSTAVVPQSTVTIVVTPWARMLPTARGFRPWPSEALSGRYGMTLAPSSVSAIVTIAAPVRPSASKSPNTAMVSPASTALRRRSTACRMSGSRKGSLLSLWSAARNASASDRVRTSLLYRSFAWKSGKPIESAKPGGGSGRSRHSRAGTACPV